jgi:hypothetical protein
MAWGAAEAQREHLQLLDAVIAGLFHAGLGLQAAEGLPAYDTGHRTEAVLGELDDLIRQIRAAAFAEPCPPPPRAPGDDPVTPRWQIPRPRDGAVQRQLRTDLWKPGDEIPPGIRPLTTQAIG